MAKTLRMPARLVLDAVERWASGCYMLREIELLVEAVDQQATRDAEQSHRVHSAGRLDSLLVPFKPWEAPFARKIGGWAWNTCRLVGIEVKVDRADLMAGLRKNQLGRYAEGVSAVYLATPKGLVKTSDVPARFGHLEIYKGDSSSGQPMYRCVCKRHAEFSDQQPAPQMFWKLLSMITSNHHARERELEGRWNKARKKIGVAASRAIAAALGQLDGEA